MFDPLTLGLIGGGIGALTGKNKLKGAAMGAGLGAAGGYLATGGLLGTPSAAMTPPFNPAAGQSPAAASAGLLGPAGEYMKPVGQALGAAQSVNGLLSQPESPIQANPTMQNVGGAETLAALSGQGQQAIDQQMQVAMAERAKRRQMYRGGA